jgi:hypothetical protein
LRDRDDAVIAQVEQGVLGIQVQGVGHEGAWGR